MARDLRNLYEQVILDIEDRIANFEKPFINFMFPDKDYTGWKFTIIGKTEADSKFLAEKVCMFLVSIEVSSKLGTARLINRQVPERSIKLLTIYMHEKLDHDQLLDDLKFLLKDYRGHEGLSLEFSEHIDGAIYRRMDMNMAGEYVPAG